MPWYNPYGYGYGGIGYVSPVIKPTTASATPQTPVIPTNNNDSHIRETTPSRSTQFDRSNVPATATADDIVNDYSGVGNMGVARNIVSGLGMAAPPGIGAIASTMMGVAQRGRLNDVIGQYGGKPLSVIDMFNPFTSMNSQAARNIAATDIYGRNFGARQVAKGVSNPFGRASQAEINEMNDSQSDVDGRDFGARMGAKYGGDPFGRASQADIDSMNDTQGSDSSSSGSDKIVCTAMNEAYGFGEFRNAVWIKYAKDNLTEAHQRGYHVLFLPLVDLAYRRGHSWLRSPLEHIARHRTADIRAEMRGSRRDMIGRVERAILEPICYIVGRLTINRK